MIVPTLSFSKDDELNSAIEDICDLPEPLVCTSIYI